MIVIEKEMLSIEGFRTYRVVLSFGSEVDVSGSKKAVVVHVPYRLRKAFRKIHVRLVRELEKKLSGKVMRRRLLFSSHYISCVLFNPVADMFKIHHFPVE